MLTTPCVLTIYNHHHLHVPCTDTSTGRTTYAYQKYYQGNYHGLKPYVLFFLGRDGKGKKFLGWYKSAVIHKRAVMKKFLEGMCEDKIAVMACILTTWLTRLHQDVFLLVLRQGWLKLAVELQATEGAYEDASKDTKANSIYRERMNTKDVISAQISPTSSPPD
jgi:hypothetical protein